MPQRPVHSPIYDDFDSIIAMERPTTPRYVVANVGVWNFSKSALVQAHSPPQDNASFDHISPPRPRTSSGMFGRIRNRSFSRPRTSDGAKQPFKESATVGSSHLKHSHTFSDFANIGVAIGSPTVASKPALERSPERPRPKRWKTIGSLFTSKRQAEDVTPASETIAQAKAESQPEQLAKSSSWPVRGTSLHLRSRTRNLSKSLRVPRVAQPDAKEVDELKKLTRSAPASLHRTASIRRKMSQRRRPRGETQPVIKVNIPRVDGFERFSVMFSELLSDPLLTGIEPPLPTPSLLERRKSRNKEVDLLPLLDVATVSKETPKERPSRPRAQTETATLRHKPVGTASLKRAQSATHNIDRTPSLRSSRSTRSTRSNRSFGKCPAYSLFPRTAENTPPVPSASTFGGTPRPSTSSGRPTAGASSTPRLGTSPAKSQTSWLQVEETPSTPLQPVPVDVTPTGEQPKISLDDPATSAALNMCLRQPSEQPPIFPPSPALSISKAMNALDIEAPVPSPSLYSARSSGEPHGFHHSHFHSHFHSHSRSRSTSDLPNLHHGPAYEVYLTPPMHTGDFPAPLFALKSATTGQTVIAPAMDLMAPSPSLLPSTDFLPPPNSLARVPSLNHSLYDYDAPHSPLVAVARTVSVCYKHEGGRAQPHLLVRAPGTRNLRNKAKASATNQVEEDEEEEVGGRASFQESVVRVRSPLLLRIEDDFEEAEVGGERMSEEEREWARRRSVWGLLEEEGEGVVAC